MKKLLALLSTLIITSLLFGCTANEDENSGTETDVNTQEEVKTFTDDSSGYPVEMTEGQSKLNESLKSDSVKGDFVKINAGEMSEEKVFLEGEVSVVDYEKVMDIFPSFTLTTKESDGFGIFQVVNILGYENIKDGDTVKIYGTVDKEKNDSEIPKITALIIEKL